MKSIKKDLKHKSEAFLKGQQLKAEGFSIYYNPYNNTESSKEYKEFISGWNSL